MIYIAVTNNVVNTTIVVGRTNEGHVYKVQRLIYFINKVLSYSKVWYPQVQKLLYALLITSRKLHHYFDAHRVLVVIEYPIGNILHNKDAMGRIVNWVVELGSLKIEFTSQ